MVLGSMNQRSEMFTFFSSRIYKSFFRSVCKGHRQRVLSKIHVHVYMSQPYIPSRKYYKYLFKDGQISCNISISGNIVEPIYKIIEKCGFLIHGPQSLKETQRIEKAIFHQEGTIPTKKVHTYLFYILSIENRINCLKFVIYQ